MKDIITRICKLLEVKSLVTLLLTCCMAALLFRAEEVSRELLTLFSTSYGAIITYFFTRKDNGDGGDAK